MSALKNAAETVEAVLSIGKKKTELDFGRHVVLAILAGVYIGFGAALALRVAGDMNPAWGNILNFTFGMLFPIGLLMVLIAGASLFTGDVMYLLTSYAGGRVRGAGVLKVLALSYLGNFLGSLFLAWLIFKSGAMMAPKGDGTYPLAAYAVNLANGKTALPFFTAFVRGVICNWLVCLAIFMSLAAQDGVSKTILMWPPIMAFVTLGMEHSVANMFFIPLGLFLGSFQAVAESGVKLSATWGTFLIDNLVPVTLGNIVGGAFFVGLAYLYAASRPKTVPES
ncbi:MAG: formate/nitrite transporter family protein [Deltaproteobacteria bacterium]|jgi:formate/nitrite transporter|nr:formate/nitrite transporter family protein [Deltaproteobacteria bacterium]